MKQPSSNNSSPEDFALNRAIAEADAIELLKERKLHFKKLKEEADKRAYAQAEAEAKRAESEAIKAEAEAKKAEADAREAEEILKQRQMELEEKSKNLKSRIFSIFGTAPSIIHSIISSFIKINKSEREEVGRVALVTTSADPRVKIDPSQNIRRQLAVYYDYVYGESNGFYKLKKDNKYGLANMKGVVVCNPEYDYIYSKDDETGLIKVQMDRKIGFLNSAGIEILAPQYDYVFSKDDDTGLIKVQQDNKYGFINPKGQEVVKPQYKYIYSMDDVTGLSKVQKDSGYGFLNIKTLKEVTPCIYNYIYSLDKGHYKVQLDGKTGFLNKDGSVFKKPQ